MASQLHGFLAPRSLAVVGASKDPTKRGYQALRALLADRFPGSIYPIHPREAEILGLRAFSSILEVDDEIDLALICTPAKTVPDILAECGKKGVKGAILLASGFSETGEEGKRIEDEAVKVAQENNIRLVGPNTSGVFNLHSRMNLVGFSDVVPGGLGIVSQSGNMALSLVTEGQINDHIGFSTYIGVGNQADIRFNEYLEYFSEEPNTAVPILYVEGFKNGRRFLEIAREVTQKKPVVVYKSGRTEAGQKSASSHTGALAGSFEMTTGVLKQAGITVVRESDEILPVAETLALLPPPGGDRVAILADGGGHATIATDALIESGLTLAPLGDETRQELAQILPPVASLANPVDVAGGTDANPGLLADCASALLQDENVDVLLVIGLFGGYGIRFSETLKPIEAETGVRLGALMRRFDKPVLLQSLYAPLKPEALETLREAGVPVHSSIETAVSCLTSLVEYGRAKRRNAKSAPAETAEEAPGAKEILSKSTALGRNVLLEHEAKDLLRAYGVSVPPYQVIRSLDELAATPDPFEGESVAMKIVSKDILHKSDAGGVKLKIKGEEALRMAYRQIIDDARTYKTDAEIEGVLVSPMAASGVEVIIGVVQDPIFGPVMMFGLGGIFVEVLKDVTFRAIPLTRADAEEMLDEIKAKKILAGVRGAGPVDRDALVDLMFKVSNLVRAHPDIAEIDLNPVIAYADGYAVVDARMIMADR